MGDRRHRLALSSGPDLGLWPDVCQREHGGHGLPVHHLQLPAGNVHLHLPLRPAEEGMDSLSRCAVWNCVMWHQLTRMSLNPFHASASLPEEHLPKHEMAWRFGLMGGSYVLYLCFYSKQVRKEYGKCLRTHCCSGKSVDSSIGSGKGTASRAPGRYSTGSQVAPHFFFFFFMLPFLFFLSILYKAHLVLEHRWILSLSRQPVQPVARTTCSQIIICDITQMCASL